MHVTCISTVRVSHAKASGPVIGGCGAVSCRSGDLSQSIAGSPWNFWHSPHYREYTYRYLHESHSVLCSVIMLDPMLTALALLVLYYVLHAKLTQSSKSLRLPPSPPSRPLIGHLLDFPKERPWCKFKEWSHQYRTSYRFAPSHTTDWLVHLTHSESDLLHLNLVGVGVLIINSQEAAVELLEKKGAIYSSR